MLPSGFLGRRIRPNPSLNLFVLMISDMRDTSSRGFGLSSFLRYPMPGARLSVARLRLIRLYPTPGRLSIPWLTGPEFTPECERLPRKNRDPCAIGEGVRESAPDDDAQHRLPPFRVATAKNSNHISLRSVSKAV